MLTNTNEQSQALGVILAETEAEARRAARLVVCQYVDLPAIMTIEEAIEQKAFIEAAPFTGHWLCSSGGVDAALADGAFKQLSGEFRCGGQEARPLLSPSPSPVFSRFPLGAFCGVHITSEAFSPRH